MRKSEECACTGPGAGGVSDQGILLTYALLFSKEFRKEVKFQGCWEADDGKQELI